MVLVHIKMVNKFHQCWDYVRTTNLNDPANTDQYTARGNATGHGQVAGCCLCGGTSPHQINYLKFPRGFGRLPTLTEVAWIKPLVSAPKTVKLRVILKDSHLEVSTLRSDYF